MGDFQRELVIEYVFFNGTTLKEEVMTTRQKCRHDNVFETVAKCADAIRLLHSGDVSKVDIYGREGLIQRI